MFVSAVLLDAYSAAPAPVTHDRMAMPVMGMPVIEITVQQAVPNMFPVVYLRARGLGK